METNSIDLALAQIIRELGCEREIEAIDASLTKANT